MQNSDFDKISQGNTPLTINIYFEWWGTRWRGEGKREMHSTRNRKTIFLGVFRNSSSVSNFGRLKMGGIKTFAYLEFDFIQYGIFSSLFAVFYKIFGRNYLVADGWHDSILFSGCGQKKISLVMYFRRAKQKGKEGTRRPEKIWKNLVHLIKVKKKKKKRKNCKF